MATRKSRKRKSETIQDMVNRILNEVEEVTIDGVRQKRTKLDIMLLQLRAASMKGDQQAAKLLLDLRRRRFSGDDGGFEVHDTPRRQ